ncbi:hypothetical protein DH2020_040740 [Rehmannia glutinosa]|uniref:Pectinesterase inhibitor domain-containing protein n=1 Tax=Rehmannia glutinosa TaxID=99300 RepID=A0ABR0UTA5_REHGL
MLFATLIPKISLFFLLTITTNAKIPTKKLFNDICKNTKYPKVCLIILKDDPMTRNASNYHDLGLGSLDIAISLAKLSTDFFNNSLVKMKNSAQKQKYVDCRDKYKLAMEELSEAKTMLRKIYFATATKRLEVAYKLPTSCHKELGEPPAKIRKTNATLDVIFDIAFVIVKRVGAGQ